MSKYLVKEIKDYFGNEVLTTVIEVLKMIDTEYGTVVIFKSTDEGICYIDTALLDKLQEYEYKFSDDEKYKDWINE
jgi:hypothetical protein